jgi:hypothetical protein
MWWHGFLSVVRTVEDPDTDRSLTSDGSRSRIRNIKFCSAVDPQWFQCGSGSRILMTKIQKKFNLKIKFFGSKIAIYLSIGLHKTSKLKENPSSLRKLKR